MATATVSAKAAPERQWQNHNSELIRLAQTGQSALARASYLESAPAKAPNPANVFRSQYAQVANYCAAQWQDFTPPLTTASSVASRPS